MRCAIVKRTFEDARTTTRAFTPTAISLPDPQQRGAAVTSRCRDETALRLLVLLRARRSVRRLRLWPQRLLELRLRDEAGNRVRERVAEHLLVILGAQAAA